MEIAITEEFIKQKVSKGKQYCLLVYKKGPNYCSTNDSIQMAHLQHLFRLREERKLLLNGPVVDDSDIRGIGLFSLTDKNEVKQLVDADPAVESGRLIFELYPWFGLPGDTLL
jgi:uncharacterized protein YciI